MDNRDDTIPGFPIPSDYNSYKDYLEATQRWKKQAWQFSKYNITDDPLSGFYRHPNFKKPSEVRRNKDYPMGKKRLEILKDILRTDNSESLTPEEDKKWILPPNVWPSIRIPSFPEPEIFENEDDFVNSAVDWYNQTSSVLENSVKDFNKNGPCYVKEGNVIVYPDQVRKASRQKIEQELMLLQSVLQNSQDNQNRNSENQQQQTAQQSSTNTSTSQSNQQQQKNDIRSKFNSPKAMHALMKGARFQESTYYETPQDNLSPKYQPIEIYKLLTSHGVKQYESQQYINALTAAYKSIPHFVILHKPLEFCRPLFDYGPDSEYIGPRSPWIADHHAKSNTKMLTKEEFEFYRNMEPVELTIVQRILVRDYFIAHIDNSNFDILNNLKNQYLLLFVLSEVLDKAYHVDMPVFKAAKNCQQQMLVNAHNIFAHVSISHGLAKIALTLKYKQLRNFLNTAVKQADNNLNSYLSKEGKVLLTIIKQAMDPDSLEIAMFLFLVADTMQTKECKIFLEGLTIRFLRRLFKYAPNITKRVTYKLLGRKQILMKLFESLFFNFDENVEHVQKLAPFFTNMCSCNHELLPKDFFKKCDGILLLISHLCAHIRSTDDFNFVMLMNKLVKFVMRYRRHNLNAHSEAWMKFIRNTSQLLISLLENFMSMPNCIKFSYIAVDAVAALASDPRYGDFFCDDRNSYYILSLLSQPDQYFVHSAYKILGRFLLNDDRNFAKIFFVEGEFHRHLVNSMKIVDVPCYIDIIKIVYKSALKFIPVDPVDDKSSQMGFLFSIATVPRQFLNLIQIIDAADFNIPNAVKTLAANKKDPVIAMRFHHIQNLRKVLKVRNSAAKLAFKTKV